MASLATTLAKVLKAASLGGNTNTQLSKDLEPNSRVLENITKSFVPRTHDMRIYTFYETEKLDFLNTLVRCKSTGLFFHYLRS
jgi:hypothetical protein